MQTRIIKYIAVVIAVMTVTGCKKFVESGDVNVNPNKPADATLNTLLPAVENATANAHFWVAYTTTLFSEQMAAYASGPINDDQNRDVRMAIAYQTVYLNGLTNAKIVISKAAAQGSPFYSAIGKILFVLNLTLATDTWGNVPYTEAFQAPAILYPHYDKQETLYPLMQKMLDEAITEAGATNNPTTLKPATDDLMYGGNMTLWKQAAWLLKARLAIHTTKKGATAAATAALAAVANGLPANTATADNDLKLIYNDKNLNPWQINVSNRILTGNFTITPSKRFVDALNGTAYPGLVDPRIGLLIDKKTNLNYTGLPNGSSTTGNTTDLTVNTFFGKTGAQLLMASFAEQKFIEAEARFILNGGTTTSVGSTQAAYDAYIAGINANMTKLGVPAASVTTYLASPLVGPGPAGLTMEMIMREKQVALFLNNEAWTDMRRYDYNASLFRGVAVPMNQNLELAGSFIRRSLYPQDELNRNPSAQAEVVGLAEKVWWDK